MLASVLCEWTREDMKIQDMRMFQRQSPRSKQRPEAFSYSSHGFKSMIVSEFLENRNIILLKFVCTHTSVKIC